MTAGRRWIGLLSGTGAAALGLAVALGAAPRAHAGVQVNVNIGPPVVVAQPPEMVMVPQSEVYYDPGSDVDLFFYGGSWYSPRGERWYRASAYDGPWVVVERRRVPVQVIRVPRDYRVVYEDEEHIPYGQWKKQWKHHRKEEHKRWKSHKKHHRDHDDDDD